MSEAKAGVSTYKSFAELIQNNAHGAQIKQAIAEGDVAVADPHAGVARDARAALESIGERREARAGSIAPAAPAPGRKLGA